MIDEIHLIFDLIRAGDGGGVLLFPCYVSHSEPFFIRFPDCRAVFLALALQLVTAWAAWYQRDAGERCYVSPAITDRERPTITTAGISVVHCHFPALTIALWRWYPSRARLSRHVRQLRFRCLPLRSITRLSPESSCPNEQCVRLRTANALRPFLEESRWLSLAVPLNK
jgi:hypothetical protein